jgi:hypothetical protein
VREKLNSNPIAQIALVLVLVAVVFVMLSKSSGGGSGAAATPTEATVAVAGTDATGTATASTAGEAVEGAVEGAVEAAGAEASAPVAASIPAPPMPAPVASAYAAGKTVVLLIVHDGGIDDRLVAASTRRLEGFPKAAVFIVPAKQIARYGAITLGVDVQQVPALVVMRPRHLSGGTPQASVSYGFQTAQGIEQAMRDASYDGPEETYHPN